MSKTKKPAAGGAALEPGVIAALAASIAPVPLAAERVASMRSRIMEVAGNSISVVRADEGEWRALMPGVMVKSLHLDRADGMQTSLWRLAPGARIPPHPHGREEECLVLEGAVMHAGHTYRQGDYLHTRPGLRHQEFISTAGALLLIRGERIPNPLLLQIASRLF